MKQKIDYKAILNLFTGQEDRHWRNWMNSPFRIGEKVYATNAHLMTIIDAAHAPEVAELTGIPHQNITGVLPTTPFFDEPVSIGVVDVRDIKEGLSKIPMIDQTKYCDECQGEGEVDYSYASTKDHVYYKRSICPICTGEGEIVDASGEQTYAPSAAVLIADFMFSGFVLEPIVRAADIAAELTIDILYMAQKKRGVLFRLRDILVLAMPLREGAEDIRVVHSIKPYLYVRP